MGDINLDWEKWSNPGYSLSSLVDQVKQTQTDCALQQLVEEPTRYAKNGEEVTISTIDHCYVSAKHSSVSP